MTAEIASLIERLARDPDIHVRRALSDVLDRLMVINQRVTETVLNIFVHDKDAHVRQRAWRVVMRLADLYPEQASTFYTRLFAPGTAGDTYE